MVNTSMQGLEGFPFSGYMLEYMKEKTFIQHLTSTPASFSKGLKCKEGKIIPDRETWIPLLLLRVRWLLQTGQEGSHQFQQLHGTLSSCFQQPCCSALYMLNFQNEAPTGGRLGWVMPAGPPGSVCVCVSMWLFGTAEHLKSREALPAER